MSSVQQDCTVHQPDQEPQKKSPKLRLTSGHLIVLSIGHNILKDALTAVGGPDVNSFCVLMNAALSMPDGLPQADVPKVTRIRANTVVKVLGNLERDNYVIRRDGEHDARARTIFTTPVGEARLAFIEEAVKREHDIVVPPHDAPMEAMGEALTNAAIRAGIGHSTAAKDYPCSFILVSSEIAVETFETSMRDAFDISLSEARILQVLHEEKDPIRVGDVAERLQIPNATTTRSVALLIQRGMIQRLADPEDRKAIYITLTGEGQSLARRVIATLNRVADEYLWQGVPAQQVHLLADANRIVDVLVERAREQEHKDTIARLIPLD